ncbi:membrane-associating domain-containing protein [Apodospora peruviana]|uniref:Membrane-associating domain-containing protein n=1 Tax=Apodospora peruviana TaxID=516989 RepID=A0AAE0M1E8_9PEZI|nr:membrane-associating domain-containing protein [Apodospora peruviana]
MTWDWTGWLHTNILHGEPQMNAVSGWLQELGNPSTHGGGIHNQGKSRFELPFLTPAPCGGTVKGKKQISNPTWGGRNQQSFKMGFNWILPFRAVQLVFSLVVLGLSAYVANWYNMDTLTASPGQINFLIFASLWSLISIAVVEGLPRFFPKASNPYVALGIEFSNMVFWFAGFVSLAVFMSRLLFCHGTVCGAAKADAAFAAFMWLNWSATQLLLAKDVFAAGFRKPSAMRGPVHGTGAMPGPSMKETMA